MKTKEIFRAKERDSGGSLGSQTPREAIMGGIRPNGGTLPSGMEKVTRAMLQAARTAS